LCSFLCFLFSIRRHSPFFFFFLETLSIRVFPFLRSTMLLRICPPFPFIFPHAFDPIDPPWIMYNISPEAKTFLLLLFPPPFSLFFPLFFHLALRAMSPPFFCWLRTMYDLLLEPSLPSFIWTPPGEPPLFLVVLAASAVCLIR